MTPPAQLIDPAWRAWIAAAPPPAIDARGDSYHMAAKAWLRSAPPAALLSLVERDAAKLALIRYETLLINAKLGDISSGEDSLHIAVASLVGAVAGTKIAMGLGFTAAVAGTAIGIGLAGLSVGVALVAVKGAATARRRRAMIEQIETGIDAIVKTL